jgi:hypothetical protein
MTSNRTEIEWTYTPPDFFEAPYEAATPEFELRFDSGTVLATVPAPLELTPDLERRILAHVTGTLLARQLIVHRPYRLAGPKVRRFVEGREHTEIRVPAGHYALVGAPAEFVHRDVAGDVVSDTKADRIAQDTAFSDSVVPKIARSPIRNSSGVCTN